MFDILIKNGFIVDGTGSKRYEADVAIKDGKIAKIGTNLNEQASKVIDAKGLIVAPGFIDSHTHTDGSFLFGTDSYNHLEDGATTEIAGQCGSAPVPSYEGSLARIPAHISEERKQEIIAACDNYKSFMEFADKQKFGANLAFFAGQGNIRGRVMAYSPEKPTAEQLEAQKVLVQEAMDAGFIGITTGFVYAPSVYCDEWEATELCKVVKANGGVYATHIRDEADHVVEAVEEAINVARASGVPTVVSHLKVTGAHNEGLSKKLLGMIDKANEDGFEVYADQYPYLAGSSPFLSTVPPKFHTEGPKALIENLKSADFRKEVVEVIKATPVSFYNLTGFDGFLIVDCAITKEHIGKTLQDIANETGKNGFDVAFDLLVDNEGTVQMVYFTQVESDMYRIIAHPRVMAGSDWSSYNKHFDREQKGGGHPRGSATIVKHLSIVRDKGLFSLEDAVKRITSMPAELYNLPNIGYIKEGFNADITIFSYENLKANADFIHPFRQNEGISYVLVNGEVAVENGTATGVCAGKVIKRRK